MALVSIPLPFAFRPMLFKQRGEPFDGARWLFEPKWDGWRCLAAVQDDRAMLLSRNGRDLTGRFPGVAQALSGLPSGTAGFGGIAQAPNAAAFPPRPPKRLLKFRAGRWDGRRHC